MKLLCFKAEQSFCFYSFSPTDFVSCMMVSWYCFFQGLFDTFNFQDADSGDWEVWATNRWTHVCIAYEKKRGFIKVIKVITYYCTIIKYHNAFGKHLRTASP